MSAGWLSQPTRRAPTSTAAIRGRWVIAMRPRSAPRWRGPICRSCRSPAMAASCTMCRSWRPRRCTASTSSRSALPTAPYAPSPASGGGLGWGLPDADTRRHAVPEGITVMARHREGWMGAELDREALYWDFTPAHLAAIDELMAKIEAAGIPFHEIRRQHFSHPALDADLAALLAHIKNGPGLVIMRGFPVDKYDAEQMQAVYWGIGTHFGRGCSQSADGDYLGYVTNVEKASRGYTTSRELNLHTDSAEIVGLLCVRDAREGGLSLYASSLKVYEIIAREHPEYLAVLERGFRCDRRGEEAAEAEPVTHYREPVFSTLYGIL